MLLDLESALLSLEIEVIRHTGDEIIAKCPKHLERTGKEDKNPSWSINTNTYVHHCFSCGYAGTLTSLYRDVLGEVPEDLEWELSKQSIFSALNNPREKEEKTPVTTSEWLLSTYVDVPEKLLALKNLKQESANFFGVKWNKEDKVWVLPIRSIDGTLLGFQLRQKGIVLNQPAGVEKGKTLFGIHLFKDVSHITVVESPLDAVRFHGVGIPAVATFGASITSDQLNLLSRNYRYVISAMDNDSAGHKANQILRNFLKKRGCVIFDFDYSGLDVKDPGDVISDVALRRAWDNSFSLNLITY